MKKSLSIIFSALIFTICVSVFTCAYADDAVNLETADTVVTVNETDLTYNGQPKAPAVTSVTCGGYALIQGRDYNVTYAPNINAGVGSVYVMGINGYTGTVIKNFTVAQCDFTANTNVKLSLEYSSVDYSGTALTPAVTVTYGTTVLLNGTDYTVEYSDNVNAGIASVKVTGKGNYCGSATKNFTIKKLSIAKKGRSTVSFESGKIVYNDAKVTPVVYISYDKGDGSGAQYLAQDVDFKVSFSNNNNIGVATAKITGLGNYTGTLSRNFKIYPATVTGVSVSNVTSSSLVLNWSKVSKAGGYDIVVYNESKGKFTHVAYAASGATSYKISNLSSAKTYVYKIRAYKTVDGKKYYGDYSAEASTLIKPAQVRIAAVTKSGKNLTVDWEKVNCSGYEIYYSTDKKLKKNVKKITVSPSKNTYTIKGINKSKRYYAKVRAYQEYNGKKYYGKKSSVVSSYFSNVYATYSSNYVNNANRTTNLKVASAAISGTIINPGQTFSLNNTVGPRTAAKGYKEAPVFTGSTGVENGLGGGICQVASTMFNCALRANVTITERHQHSQRVSYVPLGRDAAIYGNVEDFKWTNNTKYAIKVSMTVKDGVISCTFYTCQRAKPKDVSIKVKQSGKNFTMTRSVGGKVNYTAKSTY